VATVQRESDDHWVGVVQASCQVPFEFATQPAIRFILVQSAHTSELVILCHHILCDGLSLAYLARDVMVHLGDPAREVQLLPDPIPIGLDNMPADVSTNAIANFLIRRMHKKWAAEKVHPLFTNKNLFQDPLMWCYLDPTIVEAVNFRKLGGLVLAGSYRHQKLATFSTRDDVVLAILKRDKMESLDSIFLGTAVTNLTRLDLPREYGALEVDRLIMKPGGGFPLVNVNLVLGAVTCAGKLSLVIEFAENNVDVKAMEEIRDRALEFLLENRGRPAPVVRSG
jgi:hypothetical protein